MTRLVARQHLLPSLAWLFHRFCELGAVSTIELFPKEYSLIPDAASSIPQMVRIREPSELDAVLRSIDEPCVIVDDGGMIQTRVPAQLARLAVGVEQTTFGARGEWSYPTVLVCRSAAKLVLESQIIARGIRRKLESEGLLGKHRVGIVGLGALGAALARHLLDRGTSVEGADVVSCPPDLLAIRSALPELVHHCDVIVGCSGTDCLASIDMSQVSGTKTLVSCSSADVEFRSFLDENRGGFETVEVARDRARYRVMNGGYPINFDRVHEWELPEEIMLTRRLMLAGVQQAMSLRGARPGGIMLDPTVQLEIVSDWLQRVPDAGSIRVPETLTVDFFRRHSEGTMSVRA